MRSTDVDPKRRPRAAPLAPEDRREALITVVIPLLSTLGRDVTTRQIAEAAGVAEGTIFRAFPDKGSLIDAAIERAFDMTEMQGRLAAIDPTLPLDECVQSVVTVLRQRLEVVYRLLFALRPPLPIPGDPQVRRHAAEHERTDELIAALLGGSGDLRCPAREAARWVRLCVTSATHPVFTGGRPMATARIVDLVLGGIASRPC